VERPHVPWTRSFLLPLVPLAFLAGLLLERYGWLPGSRAYVPAHLGDTFDPFWEAWGDVERFYVDPKAVEPKKMTGGAIEGMLASLGDEGHTAYLSPDAYKQLKASLEGNFEGIGARLSARKGVPTIMQTMPNSPARKAGLKPGDVLLKVNGKPVVGMSLSLVAATVRGPAGTTVEVTVAREKISAPLNFQIERAKVDIPAVTWRMLPGQPIAHLALMEFARQADVQLREAVQEARQRGVKGLIVDVRGNPGGLKDQAVAVTSEFLKDGTVFIEQDRDGQRRDVPVKPGGEITDLPMVLLIDEGSASSAEIFAGAIQDHGRGKLVGTKTFGTGTVLRPFKLSDESAILLAVEQWLTPKDRQIWHRGITPDVEVALPRGAAVLLPDEETKLTAEQFASSEDVQLRRALEVLREQLPGGPKAPAENAK
jgi:carboxyl-terminal processing protease